MREFQLVDVFAEAPFSGNPLGVILNGAGLDSAQMQRITQWLNLSETTFLLPPTAPEADYKVRIFTLERELPFAGHPTLGSCHAWLGAGGRPRADGLVRQECGAGVIPIRTGDGLNAFAAPPTLRGGDVDAAEIEDIAAMLRISRSQIVRAQWVDNGPGWVAVMLESAAAVLALEPARDSQRHVDIGVVGAHPPGASPAFELRAFFSDQHGAVREDPVTGSLNASVAQWLLGAGLATAPYLAAQGTRLGRAGRIHISQDADGAVWVGGRSRTLFSGTCDF
jgi:PhzF family phenazine biosynthesis protein